MNKKILGMAAVGLCALFGASQAGAVPARPVPISYTQPDGTVVMLTPRGDETFNYLVDADGHIVDVDGDGWARLVGDDGKMTHLVPMNYNMRSDADREAVMQLHPARAYEAMRQNAAPSSRLLKMQNSSVRMNAAGVDPAKWDNADGHDLRQIPTDGERPVLVVLVNFTNCKFSFDANPQAEMSAMLNEEGYSRHMCTGSARDYFMTSSRGVYRPRFDVYGPVELNGAIASYGANSNGQDTAPDKLVAEALEKLDPTVDFAQYDTNGDGIVDNVYVFYAGYGENEFSRTQPDLIWPHAFNLHYTMEMPEHDGVKFDHYAMSNELTADQLEGEKTVAGIGTFCHEFGHVLGLPDIYSANYTADCTPGEFTIMDHGSYNNVGRTPPTYSAYERFALEWQKPIDLTGAEQIGMFPCVDGGNSYRITIDPSKPMEYYLFENRQNHSWDTYMPDHGMMVWHIDYNKTIWDRNVVNDSASHQYIDLVEADGTNTTGGSKGDLFPGVGRISAFTAQTTPAFKNWDGMATKLPITGITEAPSGVVFFDVDGGSTGVSDLDIATPEVRLMRSTDTSMSLAWNKVPGAKKYYINVKRTMADDFGYMTNENVEGFEFRDLGDVNSVQIDNLEPGMSYTASVHAANDDNISKAMDTQYCTINSEFTEIVPQLEVFPDRTSAYLRWAEIPGADTYNVTIATRVVTENNTPLTTGWDNSKWPTGWDFVGQFNSNAGYYGKSAPSLCMTEPESYIMTMPFSADATSVNFWARSGNASAKAWMKVYAPQENGAFILLGQIDNITADGAQYKLENLPEGVRQLMIVYDYTGGLTPMYIDDVEIHFADHVTDTSVAGYGGLSVTGTSMTAEGLTEGNRYIAYINGQGAAGTTRNSRAISFVAEHSNAVQSVTDDAQAGFTYADGVVRSTAPTSVYTIDGRVVARNAIGAVQLPAHGVYIIVSGEHSAKVVW